MIHSADAAQLRASDPAVSAFVAASAGSGKTKLLVDRLLRLMLDGADPGRIQCLTFTKAAAAEMANRLQKQLGAWVIAPDSALDVDLARFGLLPSPEHRAAARALFARVLDLPGGMRVGTIHAFCQSLLRRFPLEARLQPHFRVLEEFDAAMAMQEARETMLAEAYSEERREALLRVAGLVSLARFGALATSLGGDPERLARLAAVPDDIRRAVIDRSTCAAAAPTLEEAVVWRDENDIRDAARIVLDRDTAARAKCAARMLQWLERDRAARAASWTDWTCVFLKADGCPREPSGLATEKLQKAVPHVREVFSREQERICEIERGLRAREAADISHALLSLAAPVCSAYSARKSLADQLDFADLIDRTRTLLIDPGAAWVLYKLDGGLDHLLLDEVQDTAPAQWAIAGALSADFFTGIGANERRRTVFAVGDRKQSIFSFQGADPDEFERWRDIFRARAGAGGAEFRDVPLDVSFRSAEPVLALVDAVFADANARRGVVATGATLQHRAHRAGQGGSVELWPLAPRPSEDEPPPWQVPDQNVGGASAKARLAETLATWIAGEIGSPLPSRNRALAAGDVLVLVRKRDEFSAALVRALKARNVPVAGLDRMELTKQPAVADLLALCDALLLPEDELQFACFLTSPIGGLSDDSLQRLALGRDGTLWQTLRQRAGECRGWADAQRLFAALLGRVDFASPHALLTEALGPLGARARLLARLGPEAAEPMDELLRMALDYARTHPPSLGGFLHWLRRSGAEAKREAEGSGHEVRIMTVHRAKGLQAPLVVLPDTTSPPKEDFPLLWTRDDATGIEVPLWYPKQEFGCESTRRLRDAERARQEEEQNRLLYVALTRAEDRLVVCGWSHKKPVEGCWHDLVERGFDRLAGVQQEPFSAWPGSLRRLFAPQRARPDKPSEAAAAVPAQLPAWAGRAPDWSPVPPPAEPAVPLVLAPSQPEGAELGTVPAAASPLAGVDRDARFRRGRLVHALLQHLPALPTSERAGAASRYLTRPGLGIARDEVGDLIAEVTAVLDHPALAPLFGPHGRSEVPLTGVVGTAVIGGLVDRLAVLADRVILADYKTNRTPPASPAAVPTIYLRQLAAYRAVLRGAFPGRTTQCALVWTATAEVMQLSDELLDRYAPDAGTPCLIATEPRPTSAAESFEKVFR